MKLVVFPLHVKEKQRKTFYDIAISQKNESYYARDKEDMELCYLRRKQQKFVI
jgi:hypothetical protein